MRQRDIFRNGRSIAAVVGNIDGPGSGPTKWGASVKVQGRRVEHVVYMHDQVYSLLFHFLNQFPR